MPRLNSSQPLSLRDALSRWCRRQLVKNVERYQTGLPEKQLMRLHQVRLRQNVEGAKDNDEKDGFDDRDFDEWSGPVKDAWQKLLRDLCDRILREELHLAGIQTYPKLETNRISIPNGWASDYQFDVERGAVFVHGYRYTAVTVSKGPAKPSAETPAAGAPAMKPPPITPDSVRDLTDEEVFLLLEDHARRVVEGPDAKLLPGTKIKESLIPIIVRKMRDRASKGELLDTIAGESQALAAWIATKVSSHQVPSTKAIENGLRTEYRTLKAQCRAPMP